MSLVTPPGHHVRVVVVGVGRLSRRGNMPTRPTKLRSVPASEGMPRDTSKNAASILGAAHKGQADHIRRCFWKQSRASFHIRSERTWPAPSSMK